MPNGIGTLATYVASYEAPGKDFMEVTCRHGKLITRF